jgi:hypothetical protein
MHAVKKTTRQTFVTLRRYAAAVAVLVVDNRIASATPANTIEGQMEGFRTKYQKSDRQFAPFGVAQCSRPHFVSPRGTTS